MKFRLSNGKIVVVGVSLLLVLLLAGGGYYLLNMDSYDIAGAEICGDEEAYRTDRSGYDRTVHFESVSNAGFDESIPSSVTDQRVSDFERKTCEIVFSSEMANYPDISMMHVVIVVQSDDDFSECNKEEDALEIRSDEVVTEIPDNGEADSSWEREALAYQTRFGANGLVRGMGFDNSDAEILSCNDDLNIIVAAWHDTRTGNHETLSDETFLDILLEIREHTLEAIKA